MSDRPIKHIDLRVKAKDGSTEVKRVTHWDITDGVLTYVEEHDNPDEVKQVVYPQGTVARIQTNVFYYPEGEEPR